MSAKVDMKLVRQLRDMTGLGFGDCKKALVETDSDLDAAVQLLRTASGVKADGKAGREMTEGLIASAVSDDKTAAVLVQVSCETDFVARSDDFQDFLKDLASSFLASGSAEIDASADDVESKRSAIVQKLGENIQVVASSRLEGTEVGHYVHSNGKIATLVALSKNDDVLARDIAMHVAAEAPQVVVKEEVDAATLEAEKAIYRAQAAESGKPEQVQEKMVEGRVRKYLAAISLVDQAFVKDADVTVGQLLAKSGNEVKGFVRLAVG